MHIKPYQLDPRASFKSVWPFVSSCDGEQNSNFSEAFSFKDVVNFFLMYLHLDIKQ